MVLKKNNFEVFAMATIVPIQSVLNPMQWFPLNDDALHEIIKIGQLTLEIYIFENVTDDAGSQTNET